MAIAVLQSNTNHSAPATTYNVALTGVKTGSQLLLVLSTGVQLTSPPTGFQQLYKGTFPGSATGNIFYINSAPAVGSTGNIVLNLASSGYSSATLLEISGLVDQPLDASKFTNGTTVQSSSVSTGVLNQSNEIIIAALTYSVPGGSVNAAISNPPTGFTSVNVDQDSGNDLPIQHSYKIVSSNASVTATWTWTDTTLTDSQSSLISLIGIALPTKMFSNGSFLTHNFVEGGTDGRMKMYPNNTTQILNMVETTGIMKFYANGTFASNAFIET